MKKENHPVIYQAKSGAIELREDIATETIWASLQQIANLFDTDKSGISRHIRNIYESKELDKMRTVAIFATVQKEGEREISRDIEYYNLDMIISVGYRVNTKKATVFRQWATKTLKSHIINGYTINKKRLEKNYNSFLKAVEQVKTLLPSGGTVGATDALDLIKMFAGTWFSLDAYDRANLPTSGVSKKQVEFTVEELTMALFKLKHELISKGEATDIFGSERGGQSVSGIIGNIFQTFGGQDLYKTAEEKAAHLLYFMVKNHPYVDGNKRSGAFAFIWFLRQAGILNPIRLTAEALTALTLLVAESNPKDKERMIGLILLILK